MVEANKKQGINKKREKVRMKNSGQARMFQRARLFSFSLLSCKLNVLKVKWHSLYIALP